jgi:hypothetical protein
MTLASKLELRFCPEQTLVRGLPGIIVDAHLD